VGIGLYLAFSALKIAVPLLGCLLFGALISPTDPVAVLAIMKAAGAPKDLETQVAGESLFNDGVGVVAFLALLAVAAGEEPPTLFGAGMLLLRQAAGGAVVGLLAGGLTYQLIKRVDKYQVELLLTLGLAMGSYALADELEMSAPIAAVVAGLVIGNQGRAYAMSARSKQRLDEFWELIDEILNVILFMLVGLEMLVLPVRREFLTASAIAVVVSLLARWASVAAIVGSMRGLGSRFSPGAIRVLTWAGIRGGISLAMALALPPSDHAEILLAATYAVVVFSVVVQGLTIGPLIRRVGRMPLGATSLPPRLEN
jgi:monovalent cation:H+ antiporter, CPA1 family